VIDWGLVKRTADKDSASGPPDELTVSQSAMGTPDYIAPEQIHDARSADIRADIYSLGTTLYCLLAGEPPFHDRAYLQKMLGHESEAFPPLKERRSDVPRPLIAIIEKMVAKEPNDRFATPRDVVEALQPFCCGDDSRLLLGLLDSPGKTDQVQIPT